MTSGIYFCDSKGRLLLSRKYKDDIPASAIENFPHLLIEKEQESSVLPPCFSHNGVQYLFIQHNNLYILSLTRSMSVNVALVFSFLHKLVEVLQDYMKVVEEESIKDNFVIIYELLDEVMDYGIPHITETKMLRQYITQKSFKLIRSAKKKKNVVRPPESLTNSVSWRPEGIKYGRNEAFLDVVESINMLITQQGQVLRSEILGKVKVKTRLSGMPDLKLGLNDKGIFSQGDDDDENSGDFSSVSKKKSNIELEDLKFHQCVRLSKFENEKIITFIPPDGDFELMSYRLTTPMKPLIWCDVKIQVHSRSRIEVHCRAKAQIKRKSTANNVEILIPVPEDADSPKFRYSHGSIKWVPEKAAILWKLKSFPGGKDYSMAAEMGLPSIGDATEYNFKRPVHIKFQIPYLTTSGIQVRYLKITEPNLQYNSYPWVRYITQSGDEFMIRM
ncbi:HDL016Cp [Eremothecium sinecaudum]|uniref:HDL016Cp n=1 Tax=Eremothecium sinecaudum TaxID=45286 RepID=A0A109UZ25_9SACH|nr:HDL016Cp [Eremothecium sinecaudum]AMD20728.1 HDL016Cp [Eremothecium sinecaudum]